MDEEGARWTGDGRTSIVKTSVVRRVRSLLAARCELKAVWGREGPHPALCRGVFRRCDAFETLLSGVISHQAAHWRLLLFLHPES